MSHLTSTMEIMAIATKAFYEVSTMAVENKSQLLPVIVRRPYYCNTAPRKFT